MKILVKLYPLLLLIVFLFNCSLSAKLSVPFIDRHFTYPVNESPYPKSWIGILVVTPNDIEEVSLDEIEKYKSENPNYSFLLPNEIESILRDKKLKLNGIVRSDLSSQVKVKQLSSERQLVEYKSIADKSTWVTTYECTDKEVFPKTFSNHDLTIGFWLLVVGIIGGITCCFIFKYFFKKYIK